MLPKPLSVSCVRERSADVYWNGENIDRYFCNEEMAFANRSHPVPDVLHFQAVTQLKMLHIAFTTRGSVSLLTLSKVFANRGKIDLQKRWLLLLFNLLNLLHLHLKPVRQHNELAPPCKCNF